MFPVAINRVAAGWRAALAYRNPSGLQISGKTMGRGRESDNFSIGGVVSDTGIVLAVNPDIRADQFTDLCQRA
jgi:hypothetical protein